MISEIKNIEKLPTQQHKSTQFLVQQAFSFGPVSLHERDKIYCVGKSVCEITNRESNTTKINSTPKTD